VAVDAVLGYGTKLYYGADGVSYTELTDLEEIGEPADGTVEQVEATPLTLTSNAREFLNGAEDPGEFQFSQKYNKTRMAALIALKATRKYFKILYADSSTVIFQANVMKVVPPAGRKGQVQLITVRTKITGAATFTAG
jgi:hypothetical protein